MTADVDARKARDTVLNAIGKMVPAVAYQRTYKDGTWRYPFIEGPVCDFFGCDAAEVFSERYGLNPNFIHSEDRARVVDDYLAAVAAGGGVCETNFASCRARAACGVCACLPISKRAAGEKPVRAG